MTNNPYRVPDGVWADRTGNGPRRWLQLVAVALISGLLAAAATWYVVSTHERTPPSPRPTASVDRSPPGP